MDPNATPAAVAGQQEGTATNPSAAHMHLRHVRLLLCQEVCRVKPSLIFTNPAQVYHELWQIPPICYSFNTSLSSHSSHQGLKLWGTSWTKNQKEKKILSSEGSPRSHA